MISECGHVGHAPGALEQREEVDLSDHFDVALDGGQMPVGLTVLVEVRLLLQRVEATIVMTESRAGDRQRQCQGD